MAVSGQRVGQAVDQLAHRVMLQEKSDTAKELRAALPSVTSELTSRAFERSNAFATASNPPLEEDLQNSETSDNPPSCDAGLSYSEYVNARNALSESGLGEYAHTLLSPSNFMRIKRDHDGTLSLRSLLELLEQIVIIREARVLFAAHDGDLDGFLSVEELGKAIAEEVKAASSSSARMLRKQFIDTYKAIVTPVEELQVLSQGQLTNPYANWFAPATASQLKRMFTWIDGDGDGYVTSSDLAQIGRDISPPAYIGSIMLTSSFAEYLLQEHGTSSGKRGSGAMQMDFTGFLDFIIAYTSLSLSEAVQYFFSVLDLRKRGYLTRDDLLRFARTTAAAAAREHGQPIDAESVCDELIFLVRPSASGRITKSDIVEANAGRIFVPYLIDSAAMAHLDAGGVL